MKQLLLKDLYTQRLFGFLFPLIFIMPFYSISLNGANYIVVYVTYVAIWLSIYSNFGTAASNRLGLKLLSSLPVTRKKLVQGKYCAAFMWWGISLISYGTIASLILISTNNILGWGTILSLVLSLCLAFIIISVFYPLYFLFNYQVAAGITMVIPALAFFGMTFSTVMYDENSLPLQWELFLIENLLFYFLFILVSMLITFASYRLSVAIFEKKDL
ncbi:MULTISPECIES: ABC-2 transporter permease [Neobacillus]|uniref:ABC-2 transporter permease n=1 Tax=Neobacillus rhizophilus TaxID=2833579 RepID=A0A942U7B5_9BACI|nr:MULTISPECIES: ABC-2 transporter permease [Neobacillus]MBS4212809.1 ABC-2 transporter permease [Neobacillus rhizophilus]